MKVAIRPILPTPLVKIKLTIIAKMAVLMMVVKVTIQGSKSMAPLTMSAFLI